MIPATHARLHLAHRRPDAALDILTPLLAKSERQAHHAATLEVQTLRSLALWQHGDVDAALDSLGNALALGRPGGHIRSFLDEGPALGQLLALLRERRRLAPTQPLQAYADELLAQFAAEPGAQASVREQSVTVGSIRQKGSRQSSAPTLLSARLREVLALVAAGASNDEAAARMVVSVNTVKTHLSHIFAKLGVESRTQAIARARARDLL